MDDVGKWSSSRIGNAKNNPAAMAVTEPNTGEWGIVLRRAIDAEWVRSIVSRIEAGSIADAHAVLCEPEPFLRHLVLHELAHLQNAWGQECENDCDVWALEKMQSISEVLGDRAQSGASAKGDR